MFYGDINFKIYSNLAQDIVYEIENMYLCSEVIGNAAGERNHNTILIETFI